MKVISNTKRKRIYELLCICLVVLLFPLKTFAASEETSLTIKYPVSGVTFSFYKVADFSEYGAFDLEYPFSLYANEVGALENLETNEKEITTDTWTTLAKTLESYVISKHLVCDFSATENGSGYITINQIEKGLYLILGSDVQDGSGRVYTPAPVLMTVPNRDEEGQWDNQVVLDYTGKTEITDIYDEYTVIKIWDDYGNEKNRPDSIEIELYKKGDEQPYDTVRLNEANNWEYTWTNLPAGNSWVISEKTIPENYKVNYYADGANLLAVNVYNPPTPPTPPEIPQTGQLWWPVPFLAMFGMTFFLIGMVKRKSGDR